MKRGPVILLAINARYSHPSLGARYLAASLQRAAIPYRLLEFTCHHTASEIIEQVLETRGSVVCLGVYIWNATLAEEVVATLKQESPRLPIILGGPEVSYESDTQNICRLADLTISGEADLVLPQICSDMANGRALPHLLHLPPPDLARIALPYDLYTEDDLRHRNVYIESTRGCPFACSYCLSAVSPGVRRFPLETILAELEKLITRGARRIKFVDRTFNSDLDLSLIHI